MVWGWNILAWLQIPRNRSNFKFRTLINSTLKGPITALGINFMTLYWGFEDLGWTGYNLGLFLVSDKGY